MNQLRLALYQPDIPQNAGALLRLSACLGIPIDIIEPCGFVFNDRKLKRAGMDYLDQALCRRHSSWQTFALSVAEEGRRLILLTTKGEQRHDRFLFSAGDTIMVGRESCGVPPEVAAAAQARVRIPMVAGMRSLNVALSAALVVGAALARIDGFPNDDALEQVP
jgi:tRNA (cytidine/uridine-2'-O-)-methyltransferase